MAENEQLYWNRVHIKDAKRFVEVKLAPEIIVIIVFKPEKDLKERKKQCLAVWMMCDNLTT